MEKLVHELWFEGSDLLVIDLEGKLTRFVNCRAIAVSDVSEDMGELHLKFNFDFRNEK